MSAHLFFLGGFVCLGTVSVGSPCSLRGGPVLVARGPRARCTRPRVWCPQPDFGKKNFPDSKKFLPALIRMVCAPFYQHCTILKNCGFVYFTALLRWPILYQRRHFLQRKLLPRHRSYSPSVDVVQITLFHSKKRCGSLSLFSKLVGTTKRDDPWTINLVTAKSVEASNENMPTILGHL